MSNYSSILRVAYSTGGIFSRRVACNACDSNVLNRNNTRSDYKGVLGHGLFRESIWDKF